MAKKAEKPTYANSTAFAEGLMMSFNKSEKEAGTLDLLSQGAELTGLPITGNL